MTDTGWLFLSVVLGLFSVAASVGALVAVHLLRGEPVIEIVKEEDVNVYVNIDELLKRMTVDDFREILLERFKNDEPNGDWQ